MTFSHKATDCCIKIQCEYTEAERRNCRKQKRAIAMNHFSLWNGVTRVTCLTDYVFLQCLRKKMKLVLFHCICVLINSCYQYGVIRVGKEDHFENLSCLTLYPYHKQYLILP